MYRRARPRFYYTPSSYSKRIPLRRSSPREMLWRLSWPYVFTLILASLMFLFVIIIFILEIASLVVDNSNQLSNTASTGAGIWCSIFFIIPVVFMFLLVLLFDSSRIWSTYTLIAHFVSLIFMCILIGLVANAVTPFNPMGFSAPTKIQILRGQLAVGILILIFPIAFLSAYIYTAFLSLFPLRSHPRSIHPPFPIPSSIVKY